MSNQTSRLIYLVLAHFLILLAYAASNGLLLHQVQLWLLFFSWLLLMMSLFKKSILYASVFQNPLEMLLLVNLVSFVLFYFFDNGIYLQSIQASANIILLKFVAISLFLLYFISFKLKGDNFFSALMLHLAKHKFTYLVVLAVILRLAVIFYSPTPAGDAYWSLKEGAYDLISGKNPYGQEFSHSYSPESCQAIFGYSDCKNDTYPYLPATILITAFFQLIFGDVRFTLLLAQLGMAVIVYLLLRQPFSRRDTIPQLVTLLVLYLPLSIFIVEQSWIDPLSIFLLYLFVYLLIGGYRFLPYSLFGIFLAINQFSLIFLIFLLRFKGISVKKFLLAIGIFSLISVPFAVWGFKDFINDTIVYHLTYQAPLASLSFNSLTKIFFYTDIPLFITVPIILAVLIFLLLRAPRGILGTIQASLIVLFTLFLMRQGLANYYYSIACGIVLLITLELRQIALSNLENNKTGLKER